jgi:hypothetical protein
MVEMTKHPTHALLSSGSARIHGGVSSIQEHTVWDEHLTRVFNYFD